MWNFCWHSLFHEYGGDFLRRVVIRHPIRVLKAVRISAALDEDRRGPFVVPPVSREPRIGKGSIAGLGFCLKPMNPPCISGRPNHDCFYLEHQYGEENPELNPCCTGCVIGEIGGMALDAGSAVYIMTSARDILFDIYLPSLNERRFSTGLFALCRYSIRPFSVPLLIAGVRAWLFPYERGDCTDYSTWLQADIGIKNEQTHLREEDLAAIRRLLKTPARPDLSGRGSEKRENIYYPLCR